MPIRNVNNESALATVLVGTETVPGDAVTPTARLLGDFTAAPGRGAIRRSEDTTGGYDRTVTIRRGQADPSGSYAEDMTFESYPMLMRWSVKGGGTGTSDGAVVPGYTYAKSPTFGSDDVDTFTALYGVEGLPWQATGNRFSEFTITADATDTDDNWKFSSTPFVRDADRLPGFEGTVTAGINTTTTTIEVLGAGWTVDQWAGAYVFVNYGSHIGPVRQVLSNTATVLTLETALETVPAGGSLIYISGLFPVIANPTYETITLEGTRFFLDRYNPTTSTIGTTDISERVLSFNVTQELSLARKRRMPGIIARVGRGAREISGTVRFEYDRWDEYAEWLGNDPVSLRIEKTGSEIDAATNTTKLARIDVERAVWDAWTNDEDNNNMTASLSFVAALPDTAPIATFTAKNELANLP